MRLPCTDAQSTPAFPHCQWPKRSPHIPPIPHPLTASSGPEVQEVSRRRRCQYVTAAKDAKDVKDFGKLFLSPFFRRGFPKTPHLFGGFGVHRG